MITPEEITAIVNEKAAILKKDKQKSWLPGGFEDEKCPEFTPVYRKTVELYDRVRVHAVDGVFPHNLFKEKAPNEKAEEFHYRKRLYKAIGSITHPYWERAQSKLNRIWNEKNYTIEIPEIESVEFKGFEPSEYFNKAYPEFGSLEAYFKSIVTVKKIADPNAWLAIDVLPIETDTEPIKPVCKIYGCEDIWGFETDKYLLVNTSEKCWVSFGNTKKKEGYVLRLYAADGVYKIEQVGKQIDYQFGEPELEYAYAFKTLQAWPLKGKPQTHHDTLYYQSYFQPAVASLNTALIDANTLQISKIVNAFPERWERVDDCDAEGCEGKGYIEDFEGQSRRKCLSCGGSGKKNYSSPLSVLQVPVPKQSMPMEPDMANVEMPVAGYINKEDVVESLKFLREEVMQEILNAFAMINMDVSNSDVKGGETALGKQIDREEQFSFLLQISNELFDLLGYAGDAIGTLRYGKVWEPIEIGYPQNFAIRGDQELTEEINNAKTSSLPNVIIENLIKQYIGTRFNNQSDMERLTKLIFKTDRLFSFNSLEVATKLAMGTVAKWEAVLHDSIDKFIADQLEADENFWDKEFSEQRNALVEAAKKAANDIAPVGRVDPIKIVEDANA